MNNIRVFASPAWMITITSSIFICCETFCLNSVSSVNASVLYHRTFATEPWLLLNLASLICSAWPAGSSDVVSVRFLLSLLLLSTQNSRSESGAPHHCKIKIPTITILIVVHKFFFIVTSPFLLTFTISSYVSFPTFVDTSGTPSLFYPYIALYFIMPLFLKRNLVILFLLYTPSTTSFHFWRKSLQL